MAFLHGVETVELDAGIRPVTVVRSGVIGLIGIAPNGPAQALTYVSSESDIAQFGPAIRGFTIPQALALIAANGTVSVIVINVYNAATHNVAEVDENLVLDGVTGKLAYAPLANLTVENVGKTITYVKDTDFTIDEFGNFRVISSAIAADATLVVNYDRLDETAVGSADIIGATTLEVRTGGKLFENAMSVLGFDARLFISPGFSTINAVAAELIVLANKYRGHAFIDAPSGTTVAEAIAARGPAGTINFSTSDKRAVLCFPHVKINDVDPGVDDDSAEKNYVFGLSCAAAAVQSFVDSSKGYWYSLSNKEIKGISGTERSITWALNDLGSEANQLNAAGIVTYASGYGAGVRVWGNRSAIYPTDTAPKNFVVVQRTSDIIHVSVEQAMLPFVDEPLTSGLIKSIVGTVNGFLNTLIGRGALIVGSKCFYNPAKNPPTQLAAGQVVLDIVMMPPTPAERITFESFIDISLLANL